MERTVHATEYSAHHEGIARVTRGVAVLKGFSATRGALSALAGIGAPVTRATARVRALLARWAAARKERREDEKLWSLALSDARIMADLSRAMSAQAERHVRYY